MTVSARLIKQGGEGPDLLLIHGFASDSLSWAGVIGPLLKHFTVWSVDLPGHGKAPAEVGDGSVDTLTQAVVAAVSGLTGPIHVLGHSLGGAVAVALAGLRPVAAMTLIAPAGLGAGPEQGFLDGLTGAGDDEAIRVQLLRLVARPGLIQPPMIAHVRAMLDAPGRRAALKKIAGHLRAPARLTLPAVPVQVIWGGKDGINPLDDAVSRALGDALHVIPDAGHLPQVESAGAVARLVRAHHG